jgi:hypothetical protein
VTKVFNGQDVILEGSPTGDFPYITKMAYNCNAQVEYIGECKTGLQDHERRHYIEKYSYNCLMGLDKVLIAQNFLNSGATSATITVSSRNVTINLTPGNGDFREVNAGDSLYLKTSTQSIMNFPITAKIDDYTVKLRKADAAGSLDTVANEIAVINLWDCYVELRHDDTKPYHKRCWDRKERYRYT